MKKILVIEDDPDVAAVLEGLFESSGYEGHFFTSGEKALGAIGEILPDVVIMDLMMPGMNGFEICQHLRGSAATRNIPLIAMTGYDSLENRRKIFSLGVDDYLPKPFDVKVLLKKLSDLTTG